MEKLSLKIFDNEFKLSRDLRDRVIQKIGLGRYNEIVYERCSLLKEQYGKSACEETLLYHIVIMSTPIFNRTKKIDFPCDDSLKIF